MGGAPAEGRVLVRARRVVPCGGRGRSSWPLGVRGGGLARLVSVPLRPLARKRQSLVAGSPYEERSRASLSKSSLAPCPAQWAPDGPCGGGERWRRPHRQASLLVDTAS